MILNRVTPIYLRPNQLRWYRARYVLGIPQVWERRDHPGSRHTRWPFLKSVTIPHEYSTPKYLSVHLTPTD